MICIVGGGPRANWGASSLDASACCHHGSISHRLCGRHRPLRQETKLQHWDIYIEIVLDIEIQDPMACQDLSSLIYLIFTYHFCSLLECHQSYPSMASSPLQLLARGNNERHGQIQRPLSAYEGSHSYSAGGSRSTQLGSWYQSHSHTNRLKTHSWTQRTLG